ncbi:hypothetical protein FOVG_13258 [Fusarium oxysporum f. sp. pisi HDV247]|uniref:Uncharacterized protein n=1 Tax=Fusarium oxysporum f. sp. pisi HDV247 TaxID=1080344 RepID=W9P885_FUSOX|nr:hypothetical protein FOVG_13258 [Fusarium oxysporum f. sp. pisi HDV247]
MLCQEDVVLSDTPSCQAIRIKASEGRDSHDFEKDYRQIKSIRGSPAGWMDKWENVDWQSRKEELTGFKLRDYKGEKGSDKLGGHDFDITTMTEIERWRHEDK